MEKYIKCDEDFINRAMRACGPCTTAVIGITELLEQETGADVVEVRHGYWELEHVTYGKTFCSVCGETPCYDECEYHLGKYCPNCGAKMDLKEGDLNDN